MTNRISEVQIIPIKPQNGLIAFTSFVLDESLYFGSIGIVTRPSGGYRLVYPTKKVGRTNLSIYYPITREMSELIEKEVIRKFNELFNYEIKEYKSL